MAVLNEPLFLTDLARVMGLAPSSAAPGETDTHRALKPCQASGTAPRQTGMPKAATARGLAAKPPARSSTCSSTRSARKPARDSAIHPVTDTEAFPVPDAVREEAARLMELFDRRASLDAESLTTLLHEEILRVARADEETVGAFAEAVLRMAQEEADDAALHPDRAPFRLYITPAAARAWQTWEDWIAKRVSGTYATALASLRKAAHLGHPEALMKLATMMLEGKGLPHDQSMGFSLLKEAGRRGHAEAATTVYALLVMDSEDPGTAPHLRESLQKEACVWLKMAACGGHRMAMAHYGTKLLAGEEVPRDFERARTYITRAADLGDAEACFNLGVIWNEGMGVVADAKMAATFWERGMQMGHIQSTVNLAILLARGEGVPQELERAATLFRRAAEEDDTHAQFMFGLCCLHGEGVPQDEAEAEDWLRLAAKNGHADAQFELGRLVARKKTQKALKQAVRFWKQAAEAGHTQACLHIGLACIDGIGTVKNVKKAFEWWEKGAALDDASCLYVLGQAYLVGRGIEMDVEKAASYLRRASELGHEEAAHVLEQLDQALSQYLGGSSGFGTEQQPDYGATFSSDDVSLLRAEAEQGDPDSQLVLAQCYLEGTGIRKNVKRAVFWLEKAASQGNDEACVRLGYQYLAGKGVKKSREKARQLFEQARAAGNQDAIQALADMDSSERSGEDTLSGGGSRGKKGSQGADDMDGFRDLILQRESEKYASKQAEVFRMVEADAKAGDPDDQYQLASFLECGVGCEQDVATARRWYEMAALQGHGIASVRLGQILLAGEYVAKDRAKAEHWFRMAQKQGIYEASYYLGEMAEEDGKLEEAFALYTDAAQNGEDEAIVKLGECYMKGRGTAQDDREAEQYLMEAAERGLPRGMTLLAVLLLESNVIPRDSKKAVRILRKAAQNYSDPEARYRLGLCYARGTGVRASWALAFRLWKKAADNGHVGAMRELGKALLLGTARISPDPGEARAWLEKAAQAGDEEAITTLEQAIKNGFLPEDALPASLEKERGGTGKKLENKLENK